MSLDDIDARLEEYATVGAYDHYRPLTAAADEYVHWASNPQERIYTGIQVFDDAMRGTAPGELSMLQGFTHSGKTLFGTEILLNNPDHPGVLFTPDETRPLVLIKMTSALTGVGAEELERRIQADDETARELLMQTAERYGKLAVFEDTVTLVGMTKMFREATKAFGQKPEFVMFDYAELLAGIDDVKAKMSALKAWGKEMHVPFFLLHQSSRTSGANGKRQTISSGNFGGEQQATHVIGVRRKKYMHYENMAVLEEKINGCTNPALEEKYWEKYNYIEQIELPRDQDTITVNLSKNKRPPCVLVDDTDMQIDTKTGRLLLAPSTKINEGGYTSVSKADLAFLRKPGDQTWEAQAIF